MNSSDDNNDIILRNIQGGDAPLAHGNGVDIASGSVFGTFDNSPFGPNQTFVSNDLLDSMSDKQNPSGLKIRPHKEQLKYAMYPGGSSSLSEERRKRYENTPLDQSESNPFK